MTPEYINVNWTEELLQLMLDSRSKRVARLNKSPKSVARPSKVSFNAFMAKHGKNIGYHNA